MADKKKVFEAIFTTANGEKFRKSFQGSTDVECRNAAKAFAALKHIKGGTAGSWKTK